jgi:hypothetical protein
MPRHALRIARRLRCPSWPAAPAAACSGSAIAVCRVRAEAFAVIIPHPLITANGRQHPHAAARPLQPDFASHRVHQVTVPALSGQEHGETTS